MGRLRLGYDNLSDAKSKLESTYCLYGGKAIVVRQVYCHPDPGTDTGEYFAKCAYLESGRGLTIDINDPEFNCSDFNIGYMNINGQAAWFYRSPAKQWQQGLKSNHFYSISSKLGNNAVSFKNGAALAAMLENRYSHIIPASQALKTVDYSVIAFHRNFAMSYDRIHEDYIFEYKGVPFAFTKDFQNIGIKDDFKHLSESLSEVMRMRMGE